MASILKTHKRSQNGPHSSIIHILCLSAERDGLVRDRRKCSRNATAPLLLLCFYLLLILISLCFCSILRRPCTTSSASIASSSTGRLHFPKSRLMRRVRLTHTYTHKQVLSHYATIFILIIPVQICL